MGSLIKASSAGRSKTSALRALRCVESKDRKAAANNGRYPTRPHGNGASVQRVTFRPTTARKSKRS
jgi:hypothetical protein